MNYRVLLLAAGLSALLVSCAKPAKIAYFQDAAENYSTVDVHPRQIRLQPEDKISIIVNCKDQKLTNLFNLPFVSRRIGDQGDSNSNISAQGISGYTIDANGEIDFPVVGKISVGGLTREEVAARVKQELESRDLVKDPVVTVDFMNLTVSLMGEVARPGRYTLTRDHVTVLDAIAMAGDLTIFGKRENVMVIREKDGKQQTYRINLLSAEEVAQSPAYYIQQNDKIYVEPNNMRKRQSTVNGNNVLSTSFWISLASLAATVVNTIIIATR
ncbi:MAG: polysaccharide biosynthesis/export family protein [Bacteroidales bacterium]|nr:polysaccharide biosynthesis/export family protein [Bacteroidales bacterium]